MAGRQPGRGGASRTGASRANSARRGAPSPAQGPVKGKDGRRAPSGSGGYNKSRLAGRGPTPKAEDRTKHPAARRAAAAARHEQGGPRGGTTVSRESGVEHVAGRNAVVEALRADVPATALLVAAGVDRDARLTEALQLAANRGVPVLEAAKPELDRLTDRARHQGIALRVPPYRYAHPDDVLARAIEDVEPALVVALDGVTDPRNLGAVVRSAAAFGAQGVVVPARRAAGLTASAWKASAGAASRVPVAQATNLTRTLKDYAAAGLLVVGLAADGPLSLDDLAAAVDPLVVVVGSEGKGLSRLVGEACDLRVRIPLAASVESLNAGVAAGIALAEIARLRRVAGRL